MALNIIWMFFFFITFGVALVKLLNGDTDVFQDIVNALFDSSQTAATISEVRPLLALRI